MHPDRQAILWKKKKHIRFPRAERRRMLQQKALNGNEDRSKYIMSRQDYHKANCLYSCSSSGHSGLLERMDQHWDNLTKLLVALAKLEENKEEE
jgi:hypothetical protein